MITNDTNFAWNLRREVLFKFVQLGYDVALITGVMDFESDFNHAGVRVINVNNDRRGTNPVADLKLLRQYYRILKKEKPDIVFTNNIKPNVYAGIACQLLKTRYIANITGLGTPVENPGPLQRLSVFLYKFGIRNATTVFFQNEENRDFFIKHKMLKKNTKEVMLPGSGVNLDSYEVLPWPTNEPMHILFAARILKEKGIDYFIAAARAFASADKKIVFDVCGQCDDPSYLQILQEEPAVIYHGLQRNLKPWYEQSSLFLYPSYYPEGMSNVLLEAAACGRPVIATDRAGCREIVDDGKTGFVVPVKNEEAVLCAVKKFLAMSTKEQMQMGLEGRKKIEREFDRSVVVKRYCDEVSHLFPTQ